MIVVAIIIVEVAIAAATAEVAITPIYLGC